MACLTAYEIALLSEREDEFLRGLENNFSPDAMEAIAYGMTCYAQWVDDFKRFNARVKIGGLLSAAYRKRISQFTGPISAEVLRNILIEIAAIASNARVCATRVRLSGLLFDRASNLIHVGAKHMSTLQACITDLNIAVSCQSSGVPYLVGAISAAHMQEMARASEGANVASADMIESYQMEVKASTTITLMLNASEKAILQRELGYVPLYKPRGKPPRDHAVLAALREAIRQDYDATYGVARTSIKTLVVGAAAREVKRYCSNPMVHYHFSASEPKDMNRIAIEFLKESTRTKIANMERQEKELMRALRDGGYIVTKRVENTNFEYERVASGDLENIVEIAKGLAASKRTSKQLKGMRVRPAPGALYTDSVRKTLEFMTIAKDVAEENKIPDHFLFTKPDCAVTGQVYTQLVFEDVGYNFSPEDWLDWFARTDAKFGVGYMALPIQLMCDTYPQSDYYNYFEMDAYSSLLADKKGKLTMHPVPNYQADYGVASSWEGDIDGYAEIFGADKIWHGSKRISMMSGSSDNGYAHLKECWGTLFRSPVISDKRFPFSLEVNLVRGYGCLAMFRLTRVDRASFIFRTIALRPEEEYVLILDLPKVARAYEKKGIAAMADPLPYFPVMKYEFDVSVAYGVAIAERSLSIQNFCSFTRSHISGVSLVTKELVAKWRLPLGQLPEFSYAVYYYTMFLRGHCQKVIDEVANRELNWAKKLQVAVSNLAQNILEPVSFLWTWLFVRKMADQIVKTPSQKVYQFDATKKNMYIPHFGDGWEKHAELTNSFLDPGCTLPEGITVDEWMEMPEDVRVLHALNVSGATEQHIADYKGVSILQAMASIPLNALTSPLENFLSNGGKLRNDEDLAEALRAQYKWQSGKLTRCMVCTMLNGNAGSQVIECHHKLDSSYTFEMSQKEIDDLRNDMLQESNLQGNEFGALLKRVRKLIPIAPFKKTVRLEYIKGGPGTGKSFLIRALADPVRDLVVAPFLKLRSDYQNQGPVGGETTWNFHTQHKALEQSGKLTIFVDEFTAYDWRLLAVLVHRCGAETVYLVGDEQQTGIRESENEGISILTKLKPSDYSMHVPLFNYRNPRKDVSVINHLFGTRMIPVSDVVSGFVNRPLSEFQPLVSDPECRYKIIHYTEATGRALLAGMTTELKTTVRSNQGSTHDYVALPVTVADAPLLRNEQLNLVAISRHKKEMIIFTDVGSESAGHGLAKSLVMPPEAVQASDYNLRLYLGLETPQKGKFATSESEFAASFRKLVERYNGYLAPGEENDAPSGVIPRRVIDVAKVKNELAGQYKTVDFDLAARDNNCLVVALALALNTTFDVIKAKMLASSEVKDFCAWARSSRMSTWDDCIMFAKGLRVAIQLNVTKPSGTSVLSFGDSDVNVVLAYEEHKKGEGHFSYVKPKPQPEPIVDILDDKRITLRNGQFEIEEVEIPPVVNHDVVLHDNGFSVHPTLEEPVLHIETVESGVTEIEEVIEQEPGQVEIDLKDDASIQSVDSHDSLKNLLQNEYSDQFANWVCFSESFEGIYGGKRKEPVRGVRATTVDELPQRFVDYATEFVPRMLSAIPANIHIPGTQYPEARVQPVYDAYTLLRDFDLYNGALEYDRDYFNQSAANVVGDKFVTGVVSGDIISPLNLRGHPVNTIQTYRSLMVGPSQLYFKNNRFQELQVQQARYLFRKVSMLPSFRMQKIARMVATNFVTECLTPNIADVFRNDNLDKIVERALADMVIKNYSAQMDVEYTVNARVYRFQLKDIEKPVKEPTVDMAKAGQGILAWSKEAHVKFMIAFRVLNDMLLKSVKENVVYDNGMSEKEFTDKINSAMSSVPGVAVNGVIDAAACDSGQGPFTQLVERYIYELMGISDFFLDWYFSFREHYIMQSRYVRAHMTYVKTSGEPGTLLGNTILMGALMNSFLRGDGPFCMAIKGDDGFKRQMNLRVNKDIVQAVKAFTPLEFKLDINVPLTFCGYALVGGAMYPNIVRKAIKISTHRFKSYEHFPEYQESLRDWLNSLPKDPINRAIFLHVNAELAGKGMNDMQRVLDSITSVASISRSQFEEGFQERTTDVGEIPVFNGQDRTCLDTKIVTAFGDPVDVFIRKNARADLNE
nr:replication-associated protein [Rice stripe necrosis virus]